MEEMILTAFERVVGNKKFKEEGFIAGVFYGSNTKEATSVKFEEVTLRKILTKHGSNAKVWIKYGEDKMFGFIKEMQRHPVSAKINHVDVQLVSQNQEMKMQIHIAFQGEENLTNQRLLLQVQKTDVDVFGKMHLMPDALSIDVSQLQLGDTVTIKDFTIDSQIKVTDNEDEVYASITAMKEQAVEETAEEVTTEAAAEAEVKA